MSASAISQELITYFNQLNTAEKKTVLQMLKIFLSYRKEGLGKQSLEDYKKNRSRQIQKLKPAILYCRRRS